MRQEFYYCVDAAGCITRTDSADPLPYATRFFTTNAVAAWRYTHQLRAERVADCVEALRIAQSKLHIAERALQVFARTGDTHDSGQEDTKPSHR